MISHVIRFLNLEDAYFFTVPTPQKDELLSSWLVRIAVAHNTLPWTFYNLHFPEYKNIIFSRDVDIWAPKDFLHKLSIKSKLPYEMIFQMTLKSYEDILGVNITSKSSNKDINPITCRGRRNRGLGQRYCSLCLTKDIPYFKKQWRLKKITTCEEHNIKLCDKCPSCNLPISFYKFNIHDKGFLQCWKCGSNLFER